MQKSIFEMTHQGAQEILIAGLQSRFEKEIYAALRKDLDELVKVADARLLEAAKAASRSFVASVNEYRNARDGGQTYVLLFNRQEVPLDGA